MSTKCQLNVRAQIKCQNTERSTLVSDGILFVSIRTLTEKCDRVVSVLHCTTTKDVYVIKNLRNRRKNTEYC